MLVSLLLLTLVQDPSPPEVITNPDWAARPTGAHIARAAPPAMYRDGLSGRTVMECLVTVDGLLTNCAIVEEDPPGRGFGQATLSLAPTFRMTPQTRDGVPVGGARVRVPVTWSMN